MFRLFSLLNCLEPCKRVRLLMGDASSYFHEEVAMRLQSVPLGVLRNRGLSLCGLVPFAMDGWAAAGVVWVGVVETFG